MFYYDREYLFKGPNHVAFSCLKTKNSHLGSECSVMFLWIHQSHKRNNTKRLILPVKGDSTLKIVSQPMALFKWFSSQEYFQRCIAAAETYQWSHPPDILFHDISFCKYDSELASKCIKRIILFSVTRDCLILNDFIQLSGLWSDSSWILSVKKQANHL